MSKLFAIYIYEPHYKNIHGFPECAVIECLNKQEAKEFAIETFLDLAQVYGIENKIKDELKNEGYGILDEEFLNDELQDLAKYDIWEVKSTNQSLEILNNLFLKDKENFIKKYCNLIK